MPSGRCHIQPCRRTCRRCEADINYDVNVGGAPKSWAAAARRLGSNLQYILLFGGRVNNMGYNACGEIRKLRKVLVDFGLKAKIIIGSTREILNVIEWLNAVAHIVTVAPKLLEGMIVHPYSKETVQQFLQDAERAKELAVEEKSVRLDTIDSRKAITNLEAVNESTK